MKTVWLAGVIALSLAGAGSAHAVSRSDSLILTSKATKRPAVQRTAPVSRSHPRVVTGTAPDQAGYVHYFVITHPDGDEESHVGIELPDGRIAWSFPGTGVTIVPFMKKGVVAAGGKSYEVEHLYGLRPYKNEESLRALRRNLAERVAWWIDEKIEFCDEEKAYDRLCVSCLGFVLRVLYPGITPGLPALPADFRSVRRNIYTTEDFLLYLVGVRTDLPRDARRKRIAALDVPDALREELVRIAVDEAPQASVVAAQEQRPGVTKPRATARSLVKSPRRLATKRGS